MNRACAKIEIRFSSHANTIEFDRNAPSTNCANPASGASRSGDDEPTDATPKNWPEPYENDSKPSPGNGHTNPRRACCNRLVTADPRHTATGTTPTPPRQPRSAPNRNRTPHQRPTPPTTAPSRNPLGLVSPATVAGRAPAHPAPPSPRPHADGSLAP